MFNSNLPTVPSSAIHATSAYGRWRAVRTSITTVWPSDRTTSATVRVRSRPGRHAESPRGCQSGLPNCAKPINTGGTHWVLDSAIHSLSLWVTFGIPPPQPPTRPRPSLHPWCSRTMRTGTPSEGYGHLRSTYPSHPGRNRQQPCFLHALRHHRAVHFQPAHGPVPQPPGVRAQSGICPRSRTSSLVTWSRRTRSS